MDEVKRTKDQAKKQRLLDELEEETKIKEDIKKLNLQNSPNARAPQPQTVRRDRTPSPVSQFIPDRVPERQPYRERAESMQHNYYMSPTYQQAS